MTNDDADDCSEANTLATLPSYIGKTEIGMEIFPLPLSSYITLKAKDTLNLPSYPCSTSNSHTTINQIFKSET